jgi:hypothetical protein
MTPEQRLAKGEAAQRLYDDPLLRESLDAVRDAVRDLFFALDSKAEKEREFLHLMDRARQQFENVLLLHIAGAQIERSELLAREHTQARVDALRGRVIR